METINIITLDGIITIIHVIPHAVVVVVNAFERLNLNMIVLHRLHEGVKEFGSANIFSYPRSNLVQITFVKLLPVGRLSTRAVNVNRQRICKPRYVNHDTEAVIG